MTRIAQAGLFDDRQRVEVGADQQSRAVTVLEDRYDSIGLSSVGIFTDALRDREARFAQLGRQQ